MAERRASLMDPRIEQLMAKVDSKFTLVTLSSMRAREINDYYNQLGEGLGRIVPPQVTSVSRKPLSIAMEEVAAGKIKFERLRDAGGFLESFDVYGDLKGTPRQFVVDSLAGGHDVLLELDVHGALAVRAVLPHALLVFVRAPSREEQRRRLETRDADDLEAMKQRLARAEAEERIAQEQFDAVVVNDDVDRAVAEVAAIVEARRSGSR